MMKHFFLLFLFPGFLCYNFPIRIRPHSLVAWEGSCVLLSCEISKTLHSAKVNATGVIWFFEPVWNNTFYDYSGSLLYDSDKTLEENAIATSAAFRGRVRFVGNLSNGDCSLVISQLQTMDSGSYGARVVAFVAKDRWRHKWFQGATVNVTELPSKPKIDIISRKIQGNIIMQVACSIFYLCPDEPVTLMFHGLEKHHLSSQTLTRANGTIKIMATLHLAWEDDGKKMSCLLKNRNGSRKAKSTVELSLKFAPMEVNVHQYPEGLIFEGDPVNLTCEVGMAYPKKLTYAWYKDGQQLQLGSLSETLTIPRAERSMSGAYWCEASNTVGTSESSTHMLYVTCFSCDENIFQITPSSLLAWHRSCVVLSCQVNEMHDFAAIRDVHVVWYFEPSWNYSGEGYNTTVLYDSSKTLENQTSPPFQGRIRFVGDLARKDCSLMVTQLQVTESGRYGARVLASIGKHPWRLNQFISATVNVSESPPEPTIEMVPPEIQENVPTKIICSVPYDCPDEPVMLMFHGLEEHHLSSETMSFGNRRVVSTITLEPTWEDDGKILSCILRSQNGKEISRSTLELDVKYYPKDVQVFVVNQVPIKEGDTVVLNCSVGRSNPSDNWYNWIKSDSSMVEFKYSAPKLLSVHATPDPVTSYNCEVCNYIGCTSSPTITLDVHS